MQGPSKKKSTEITAAAQNQRMEVYNFVLKYKVIK